MENKLDFKQRLERLEKILENLNDENVSIDESLALYEEGKNVVKSLEESLKEAEQKVEQIIESD